MRFDRTIYTYDDAQAMARERLPWMVFDYIDGAAGDGFAEARNRKAMRDLTLQPRVLNNVEERDMSVEVFGNKSDLPFGVSPMGTCNLSWPGADVMLAHLAAETGMPLGVSTAATTPLENIIIEADGNAWFQLYFSGNEDATMDLIGRAEAAGYGVLVLTVDVPEIGRRPRELKRGFKVPFKIGVQQFIDFALHPVWSLSTLFHGAPRLANFDGNQNAFLRSASRAGADWGLLQRIRERWKGKLVVKGILSVEDALKLKEAGVDGIQVSSHGGRQLNSAPPPILMLKEIREDVGDLPLFYDSGVRNGEDIVKAYAMGADFVFLGRPFLFAMAANGKKGLSDMVTMLKTEVDTTLAQLGRETVRDLDGSVLSDA